jgi:glycosyltransferase involved in cell wall biosynthesis
MLWVYWIAAFGAIYSYMLYPAVLLALRQRSRRVVEHCAAFIQPRVSIIIAAHNEQSRLPAKLASTLALEYPSGQFEIIVASDCSTDKTDVIAQSYAARGVRLVRSSERFGKEHAQWVAVQASTGEILVFTDVGTEIPPEGVAQIVSNFADPTVGSVSSEDRFVEQDGRVAGEGLYIRYEMWLRRLESEVNSLVGLSGSFFAIRRELCVNWDASIDSDFNGALSTVQQGFRAVTDPRALGFYRDIKNSSGEYQRKVRTVLRGITAIARHPVVLNPLKLGFFAFQVWSHKVLRWAVPWFLLALLIVNCVLSTRHWFFALTLLTQGVLYFLSIVGWFYPRAQGFALVKVCTYFATVNLAMAEAFVGFVGGRRVITWTPSKR